MVQNGNKTKVPGRISCCVDNMASPLYNVLLVGAYLGNYQYFLAQGANLKNMYLVTPCHLPQNNLIFMALERCCLMVFFAIPTVVALSPCTRIFGCGCPRSSRVSRNIMPSWQLRNSTPSSASMVDATTNCKIEHNVWNAPFNLMSFLSWDKEPMKKLPQVQLCTFGSVKYDASEWIFITILDAQKCTLASGCVAK